jgi:hypothetical protein
MKKLDREALCCCVEQFCRDPRALSNCKSMRSAAIRGSNARCFVNGLSVFEPDPLAALRSVAEAKQAEPA